MLLSQAFRLLEDGEILTDGHLLFKLSDEGLMYSFTGETNRNAPARRIGQCTFKNCRVLEKPKEKVQQHLAMIKYHVNGTLDILRGHLFVSEQDYHNRVQGFDFDLIQLVKFGDPT